MIIVKNSLGNTRNKEQRRRNKEEGTKKKDVSTLFYIHSPVESESDRGLLFPEGGGASISSSSSSSPSSPGAEEFLAAP
jgi:hypothetical protein